MAQTILRKLGGAVVFLRRKIEVWFVLMILIAIGILGWAGFRRVENTQDGLCQFAQASADTKDVIVTVLARETGRPATHPVIVELRTAINEERSNLDGYCPPPTPLTDRLPTP